MKYYLLIIIAILVSGCSSGPVYKPVSLSNINNALVYIYRPNYTLIDMDPNPPLIALDKNDISTIGDDRFIRFESSPGIHSLNIFSTNLLGKGGLIIKKDTMFDSGKTYYYKLNYRKGAYASASILFSEIDENTAKRDLTGMIQDN